MTIGDALLIALNSGCGSGVFEDCSTISMYSSMKNSTLGTSTRSLLPSHWGFAQPSEPKHQQFELIARRRRRAHSHRSEAVSGPDQRDQPMDSACGERAINCSLPDLQRSPTSVIRRRRERVVISANKAPRAARRIAKLRREVSAPVSGKVIEGVESTSEESDESDDGTL